MFFKIFFAVIVSELFARFNGAAGNDKNAPGRAVGFAIGHTGVVDEARGIRGNVAVYHCRFSRPKEIFALVSCHFFQRCWSPGVFNNTCTFRDRLLSKKPAPRRGLAHAELTFAGCPLRPVHLVLSKIHPADIDATDERDGKEGDEVLAKKRVPIRADHNAEGDSRELEKSDLPKGERAVGEKIHRLLR